MRYKLLIGLLFLIFSPLALAARAPKLVEKTFVLKGENAKRAAAMLGLDTRAARKLVLPWSRSASLRNCTFGEVLPGASIPSCNELPILQNSIEYVVTPEVTLTLGGTWNDERTGSGPRFHRFSLPSPDLSTESPASGDWRVVPRTEVLKNPLRSSSSELPALVLTSYQNGSTLLLALSFDTISKENETRKNYEECSRTYAEVDGAPC